MTRRPRIVMTSFGFTDAGRRHPRPAPARVRARPPRLGRHGLLRGHEPAGAPAPYDLVRDRGARASGSSASSTATTACGTSATRAARSTTRRSPPPSPRCSTACSPTSSTSTTCTTSAPRCSTRPPRAASARSSPPTTSGSSDPRGYLLTERGRAVPGPGAAAAARRASARHPAGYEHRLRELRARFEPRRDRDPRAVRERAPHARRRRLPPRPRSTSSRRRCPPPRPSGTRSAATGRPDARCPAARSRSASSAPCSRSRASHLLVHAAQIAGADVRVEIHGDIGEARFRRNLEALDTRGVVTFHGAFAHDELPERLARVDVAAMPSIVWGTAAPSWPPSASPAACPCSSARWAASPSRSRDGVDGLHFDGRDARQPRPRASSAWQTSRGCSSASRPASRRPRRSPPTSTRSRPATAASSPNARTPPAPLPRAVRWVGDHDLHTSLSIINREVVGRLRGDAGLRLQRVERTGVTNDPPLAHLARRRGPPPVAAGLLPGARRPARGHPALGVRRDPGRLGRADRAQRRRAVGAERVRAPHVHRLRHRRRAGPRRPQRRRPRPLHARRPAPGHRRPRRPPAVRRRAHPPQGPGRAARGLPRGVRRPRRRHAGRQGLRRRGHLRRHRPRRPARVRGRGHAPARRATSRTSCRARRWPRCTAPATSSCTRTAARASPCRCSRRWPAACR